jgi:MFS family permease
VEREKAVAAGPPAGGFRAAWSLLRRNRDFRRLFLSSVISLGGDWFLFVAIGSLVLETTERALFVGFTILSQELAFFAASPLAGILADRVDRRRLMIGCDLARAVICVAFLAVGETTIWLAFPLLAMLSFFAAPFDAASPASIPNLVEPDDLATANAVGGSLWGTMLAVGAALGGFVAAAFGHDTAFLVDGASFVVSALLLVGIQRPFSQPGTHEREHPSIVGSAVETVRYARTDHRVLALLSVKAGFGVAAGVLALIPVFAQIEFGAGEIGFGLLMACRGLGALIGPFLGHRLSGQHHERLFAAILGSLVVFGLGYLALGAAPAIWFAAAAILFAHLGGGAQWVLSTYGLQVIVPDSIRGRIFGFDLAFITLSLALSSLLASWLADSLGPREAAFILGGIALAFAGIWWTVTGKVRRQGIFEAPAVSDGPPSLADASLDERAR